MPAKMGACLCRQDNEKSFSGGPLTSKKGSNNLSAAPSSKGVGLGISMMMHQAGMLAAPNLMDLDTLRSQMRKAKAEGRTVSVLNGCVYIDYQLKAQIPAGFNYDL